MGTMKSWMLATAEGLGEGVSSRIKSVGIEHYVAREPIAHTTDLVQCEDSLTVRVGGRAVCQLSCSADHLTELAVGHLLTQGIVSSGDDIDSVVVSDLGYFADIELAPESVSAFSTEGEPSIVTTSSARLAPVSATPLQHYGPIEWQESWVYSVSREFAKDKTSHARTRGCHSAYLANENGILVMREDVGRHNAVDKVVGWAVLNNINLSECLLYTSGRVPTDMVMKAIRARIPILASKSVTTDKAVELARSVGLVLLCEARPESFELLSGEAPQIERPIARAI